MKLKFLKYKTKSYLKSNTSLRTSLPYQQAKNIGIIFTVEDKRKHDEVKEFVRRLELEGKAVTVLCFLPRNKDNYEFLYDFFTDKELSFWGTITSESALRFANTSFDYLFYLDVTPNPFILNIIARSKAHCRVGRHFDNGEPYFEFMLQMSAETRSLIDSIHRYTSRLH